MIAGTRPEIIKLAPLYHALQAVEMSPLWLDTGQHAHRITQPLYQFFQIANIRYLPQQRRSVSLGEINAGIALELARVLETEKPQVVVVQGDTVTALQGALNAFLLKIPIAHVEAGLRTGNFGEPFPEEMNRTLIARLANWNFAPTPEALDALVHECVPGKCFMTGNTVVDAAYLGLARLSEEPESTSRKMLLITAHRRENWGEGIRGIAQAVRQLLEERADIEVCWILHPNPAISDTVREVFQNLEKPEPGVENDRATFLPPQNYPDMLRLLKKSWVLLTDSGGLQEEATVVGKPVLITRDVTERPEILACGMGILVGTRPEVIQAKIHELLRHPQLHRQMCQTKFAHPFGDGRAAERIAQQIAADVYQ